jgi:ABC-type sugar transport system ATPase subunit
MDEPTTALSAGESERLFALIRQLRAEGLAIIYISHRMDEVYALGDRIAVLRDGRLVEEGEAEALCVAPRESYTRALLAATPALPSF